MILLGAIAGVHGVRGEVKVKSFTADPWRLPPMVRCSTSRAASFDLKLSSASGQGHVVIARIDGVADRNAAEALKGKRLYVPRERLPAIEDETSSMPADLIGLAVEDRNGKALGKVVASARFRRRRHASRSSGGPQGDFDLPFADALRAGGRSRCRPGSCVDLPEDFFDAPKTGSESRKRRR